VSFCEGGFPLYTSIQVESRPAKNRQSKASRLGSTGNHLRPLTPLGTKDNGEANPALPNSDGVRPSFW